MTIELTDTVRSLTGLIRQENALLTAGSGAEVKDIALAKQRLAASLEQQMATLEREQPNWHEDVPVERQPEMAAAMSDMAAVAAQNKKVLERHIELSRELLGAIGAEARRLSGASNETYGAAGTMRRSEVPTPFAVNARL